MDPFAEPHPDAPAPATGARGVKFNATALAALTREVSSPPADTEALRESIRTRNASRRYNAPAEDEQQAVAEARKQAASANWSPLDMLALRRAGAAIIGADGRGEGVTEAEARALCSRTPDKIAMTARQIVLRLADPGIDALIIEKAEAGKSFLPETE